MTSTQTDTRPQVDKEALKLKYRAERDKRLRPDGNEQYLQLTGRFAHYAEDPYTQKQDRAPVTDHVTFAFVGGGFAGLIAGARVKESGVDDVRIIEKGGDFGGTWYWNRYPGAQCDTASMVYMPLLEETGHMPSEKYAHAPEILAHSRRIGKHFGLYENALFHTEVDDLVWDQAAQNWIITTNRGDRFTAQFVGIGTGPLHVPKLPGIPGIEDFKGHAFHTSRWDYDYTGGSSEGAPLDRLADKRVAIIGTGATSVQAVPHLAGKCRELYVVQRTPSSVDQRDNHPLDPDWFKDVATEGWQQRWMENFTDNQSGGQASEDYVMDGWTELARRIKERIFSIKDGPITPERVLEAYEDADFEKMEEIRARAERLVNDPDTAENLKAWYRQLCKRPCFHDAYLQAFNQPDTWLVDTDGQGVERITETGFVVAGKDYQVDCIIFASGFEVGTPQERRSGFDVAGRDGLRLSEAWANGMQTLHGNHVHGFPNLFILQPTQGANLISNVPHNLVEGGRTVGMIVGKAVAEGVREVEVTKEAQDKWIELLLSAPPRSLIGSPDCTPGYYNNEGQGRENAALWTGYPGGASAYFKYVQKWRTEGGFEGLEFR